MFACFGLVPTPAALQDAVNVRRVAEITIRGVTAAPKYPSADSLEDIEGMR